MRWRVVFHNPSAVGPATVFGDGSTKQAAFDAALSNASLQFLQGVPLRDLRQFFMHFFVGRSRRNAAGIFLSVAGGFVVKVQRHPS